MGLLRPRRDRVDSRFLLYVYMAPSFQQIIRQRTVRGATVDRIPLVELPNWPITLPPMKQQQTIAAVLGVLDDKIAVNDQIMAVADELVRSHYIMESLRAEGRIFISDLGDLIHDTVPGESLLGSENYIGLEHMPRRNMWLSEWDSTLNVVSAKNKFEQGDVLFGKLRPYFHKVGVAFTSGVSSTDIFIVRARAEAYRGWLLAALASDEVVAHASAVGDGTRMPRAKWGDIAQFQVPWIGSERAREFDEIVVSLMNRVRAAVMEINLLARVRDTLLPKLMSGEIQVREAERIVEDAT